MLPYKLLFNIGSKAVWNFYAKKKRKSERKHAILLYKKWQQEMKEQKEMALYF